MLDELNNKSEDTILNSIVSEILDVLHTNGFSY